MESELITIELLWQGFAKFVGDNPNGEGRSGSLNHNVSHWTGCGIALDRVRE